MRTAIFSDIHGDLDALRATLADIAAQNCDRAICLGDLVDGGENSAAVVRMIRELNIAAVRGNHDDFPDSPLPPDVLLYLKNLRETIVESDVIYTHISPRPPDKQRKVCDDIEVWNVFNDDATTTYRRIFIGDVHIPMIWGEICATRVSATPYPIPYDVPLALDAADRYLICVGSVAANRDASALPRYAIYDDTADTILFHAVAAEDRAMGRVVSQR